MSSRLHVPSLRVNVVRDWFIAPLIALLIIGPAFLVVLSVWPSEAFWAFAAAHPAVPFATLILSMLLVGILAVVCLAATVLGDPGLLVATASVCERHATDACRDEDEAHYCRLCCTTIYKFDHHCGVIGACIGGRNMWSFIAFLGFGAIYSLIGLPVVASFAYTQLKAVDALTFHAVWSHVSISLMLCGMSCMAALHGGSYCALMFVVYVLHVVRGTDTVARRHATSGRVLPSLPPSPWYRLRRCFSCMFAWRSAYAVQCTIDASVCLPV
jgi:hypothetical protein